MRPKVIISIPIILWIVGGAFGQETGYDIMKNALNRTTIQSMEADLKLILQTGTGDTREREIKFYSKTDPGTDLTKMLMRFVYPQDVRGTGFLTLEYADRPDDRFLYMPALRRIKKIASSGSGGNFMSSDFTYYDIGTPELADWTYALLREESFDGIDAYVIEATPGTSQVREDTGYSKIIHWVAKDDLRIYHSEYFDQSGELKKRLNVEKFERVNGFPFATEMVMHDVIIDHTSRMIFENLEVNNPIPDSFFTPRMLQRGL
ncbi:MAG: outer membrane lipoprotein-sorting protein [Lentisphaeria bacterium]|nr:outer membrane lipoprotein-sorting protein [Candidatus Neomarinimicrobiota bacterium]MCF7841737.1 outer membrane lipoprotein-sorting protein [Lentisphaeria bacterium]